jgi:peptidoglycan/xylan/chitin deacetylase (PgdA/CDA1 family)
MLFWDYDAQWGADRSRTGPKPWGLAEFLNTERLLGVLADRMVPSVFACVGAVAQAGERPYHDPDQIRRIHDAGHEVASHSYKHEWLPGLSPSALRETLLSSRLALEDCIGAEVVTFVPPWNQPYDFLRVGSLSLSERREVSGRPRTDVPRLCSMLRETGYRFTRLAFRGGYRRIAEWLARREYPRPAAVRELNDIKYVLLNTAAGFDGAAHTIVDRVVNEGGIAVLWGHPHSLTAENSQNMRHLTVMLDRLIELRAKGLLEIVLPHALV